MTKKNKHDKAVSAIVNKPYLIGLENIVIAIQEPYLFDHTGRLIGRPDGLFMDNQRMLYIMEYQVNRSHPERAKKQLLRTKSHLETYGFKDVGDMFYVFGRNNYMILKG